MFFLNVLIDLVRRTADSRLKRVQTIFKRDTHFLQVQQEEEDMENEVYLVIIALICTRVMSTGSMHKLFSVMLPRLSMFSGRCAGIDLAQAHPKMIWFYSEKSRSDAQTVHKHYIFSVKKFYGFGFSLWTLIRGRLKNVLKKMNTNFHQIRDFSQ